MKWLMLIPILVFSLCIQAETIKGPSVKEPSGIYINLSNLGTLYKINTEAMSPLLRELFHYLESDDYFDGFGRVDTTSKNIYLGGVDSIGLDRLIGVWKSDSNDTYSFTNFSSLELSYNPDSLSVPPPKKFRYRITPNNNGQWSILFIGDDIHIGTLIVDHQTSTLQLYDQETGQLLKVIRLYKN